MRFKLTVRDGRVLTGEIVGEVGSTILFRDDPGTELLSIPIKELTGAWALDDGPLEIGLPLEERADPYYEINESMGDLVVSMDSACFDRVDAKVRGRRLVVTCSGPHRSDKLSIPLPFPVRGIPSIIINERIAEITLPLP